MIPRVYVDSRFCGRCCYVVTLTLAHLLILVIGIVIWLLVIYGRCYLRWLRLFTLTVVRLIYSPTRFAPVNLHAGVAIYCVVDCITLVPITGRLRWLLIYLPVDNLRLNVTHVRLHDLLRLVCWLYVPGFGYKAPRLFPRGPTLPVGCTT